MAKPRVAGSGDLRDRLHFQKRGVADDGFGNEVAGPFVTAFTAAASMLPLAGGEAVQAARLASRQPYVVTIRQSMQARQITTAWRIEDARTPGRYFNITAVADPDGRRQWLELLVTEGGPGGE